MAWLFVLFVVVFIHELGHFLVARWCGVKVSTFSIGFGREIVGFNDSKGTRWKLGWIPLGGYVKFMDDENGASVPSRDKMAAMSEEERQGSFHFKPLWQKAAVVVAGPVANFLSAIAIFAAVGYFMGTQVVPAQIEVMPNPAIAAGLKTGDVVVSVDGRAVEDFQSLTKAFADAPGRELAVAVLRAGDNVSVKLTPARTPVMEAGKLEHRGTVGIKPVAGVSKSTGGTKGLKPEIAVIPEDPAVLAGLKTGDLVVKVDGQPMADFGEMSRMIAKSPGRELSFDVLRDGSPLVIKITPQQKTVADGFGGNETRGIIGVRPGADRSKLPVKYPGVLEAVTGGVEQTWMVVSATLGYLNDVFSGRQSGDKIGGLPTIIDVSNQVAQYGVGPLLSLIGLISVSIGLLNLFPIPLLDGGHLVFYAIEALMGRPLSDQTQEFSFRIGLAIVSTLMVFALWNDRGRMYGWWQALLQMIS